MAEESGVAVDYRRRHLRFGWWSLFGFAVFGLILETLHAFKVREYLDVSNDTRRLMWTLAREMSRPRQDSSHAESGRPRR